MDFLLIPPVAFLLYLGLVWIVSRAGRKLAGPPHASVMKSSTYSSGESNTTSKAAPGYRPFFLVALFFAILHLGVLVAGQRRADAAHGHLPGRHCSGANCVNTGMK